eukprot:m.39377 g.39377  ORF g.39377 m.39377 type:complete len:533 (+) comp6860_c1_seq2:120-1718(+)
MPSMLLSFPASVASCCSKGGKVGAASFTIASNAMLWKPFRLPAVVHSQQQQKFNQPLHQRRSFASMSSTTSHPKFVPFQLTQEDAKEKMKGWMPWFAPKSIKQVVETQSPTKAFIPFWVFEVDVHSRFRGQVEKRGTNVSFDALNSVYEVTDGTGWTDTHGWVDAGDRHYDITNTQMQVFAGCSFRRENVQALKGAFVEDALTFHTSSSEHFLQIEESIIYPVEADALFAWALVKTRLHEMEAEIGEEILKDYFDAKAVRKMRLKTSTSAIQSQLIYLPAYIYTYHVGKNTYRAFISGVSGAIGGQRISSAMQVGSAVGVGAGALTALVFPEPLTVTSVASLTGGIIGGFLSKLPEYRQRVFDKNQTRELERQMFIRDAAMDLGTADEHLKKESSFQSMREREFKPNKETISTDDLADPDGHYARLGLETKCQNSTLGEIKEAFRGRVVQSVMKSRLDPSFSEAFSKLCDSYRILRNEKRRLLYDNMAVSNKRQKNRLAEESSAKMELEEQEKENRKIQREEMAHILKRGNN